LMYLCFLRSFLASAIVPLEIPLFPTCSITGSCHAMPIRTGSGSDLFDIMNHSEPLGLLD
jgi:hypothetical protein